ncbi:MAG: TonB-dependent receptor [Acidobacteriaceae bacterium]|nr:TonB-dependent receptor [Acidobacteriaceae bacterium]
MTAVSTERAIRLTRKFRNAALYVALSIPGILVLSLATSAFAQDTTATVVGVVTDTTGAIVVGAKVTILNAATNTTRTTVTDNSGQYSVPSLPPGTYTVSIEMSGFKGQRTTGVVLEAGQVQRLEFNVTPGQVSETVTVETSQGGAQLQTENGVVGEVIDAKKIVDLPLNGRNFVQLAQLIPGVNPGTAGSITVRRARGSVGTSDASGGSTAIQVNGQRDTQNRYSIDGIEAMDYDAMTFSFSPSIDAISQFRVDTSSSGADAGAAAGANVNQIIKSGTNAFHGTLWEFNRNNAFTQTYDALAGKDAKSPRLNRNQFGANIGGPVWIPHIYNGRDKTFFFFNWESGYGLSGANPQFAFVPTAAIRTGNVAGLNVKDPLTGLAFPNDQIPQARLSKPAQILLSYTPAPNSVASSFNYTTTPINTLSFQYDYIVRLDHTIGHHDTISGHYIADQTYLNGGAFWGNDQDNNDAHTHNYSVSETHVFSPSLVNEFRYGHQKFEEFEKFGTTGNANFDVANKMGIPFASSDPKFFGPPNVTISGPDGVFRTFNLQRTIGPRDRNNTINQFVDQVSYQRGKHFMKFAVDIGLRTDFFSQARDPRGAFTFDGRYSGSAQADFMLGYVAGDSINPAVTRTQISSPIQGYSFQDNWNITRNLTLNLGIRYDHFATWKQDDDKFADIFIAANGINPGSIMTPATSPYGRGLIQTPTKDIAPRVGFAWQPLGMNKMVVRGGYGLYYTPEISNAPFSMAEGAQAQSGASLTGSLKGQLPNINFDNPFPGVATGGPLTYPFANALDQNMQDQQTMQYNLIIQTQLPAKVSAEIGYVGAKGTHNFISYTDINIPTPVDPATPGLASIVNRRPNQTFRRAVSGDFSRGTSQYNALQTKLERRVGTGLTFLVAYTWSKSISGPGDVGGIVGGGFFGAQGINIYNPKLDRSISVFNIPHRFVGTVLYDLPFFKNTNGFKKLLLDGFQVSTIVTAQSGLAAAATNTVDTTGTGVNSRPDLVPGQTANLAGSHTYQRWFNTAAFAQASPGQFGTSPRTNAVQLPGLVNDDFSVTKGLKFGEGRNLQIRADFFNTFKHYNPDPQTVGLALNSKSTFGVVAGGTSGGFATRVIQLAAKFYF